MDNQQYISLAQAAKILGISRIAVYKKVKNNQLPAMRVGRSFVVTRGSVAVKNKPQEYSRIDAYIRALPQKKLRGYLKNALWDYDISFRKSLDFLTGKKQSDFFNRNKLYARLITTMTWQEMMRVFGRENVKVLVSDEVLKNVWPQDARQRFEFARKAVYGE